MGNLLELTHPLLIAPTSQDNAKAAYKAFVSQIESLCPKDATLRASIVRTVVGLMAAIFTADGQIQQAERNLIEEMVEGVQIGTDQFIEMWSERWNQIRVEIPLFLRSVASIDKSNQTTHSIEIVEQLCDFGRIVASIDGNISESEQAVVDGFSKFLIDQLAKEGVVRNNKAESQNESIEDILRELRSLIGIQNVKQEVESLVNFAKVARMRAENNLKGPEITRHMVFVGNPGTGKTTVARLLGQIYGKLKVLPKGHVIETDRSGLVAGYAGQTAIKVASVVESARGGVLFIDEAYALTPKESSDYASEAVATLLKLIEDHRADLVVILAGYEVEMEKFLDSNPGFRSRFAKTLRFSDYSQQELADIFVSLCASNHYTYDETVGKLAHEAISQLRSLSKGPFSNARTVRTFFEEVVSRQANRIAQLANPTLEELTTITTADIPEDPLLSGIKFR